ncbi:MAG: response regulator [Pirellulales bacterium]|nr:response regulator [Pirellulales bacterium]
MAQPYRILVAEDNQVLSDVLRFNLERAGYAVTVADNGETAKHLLNGESWDLLMTDYQMPLVNGEELCRHARQLPACRELPIIMCSAKGLELNFEDLRQTLGIQRLLHKPFSMKEIVKLVATTLAEKTSALAVG